MFGIREGGNTIFRRKSFVSQCRKNFVEEPFCSVFQKLSGSEKVHKGGGGAFKFSVEKIFLSQCRKISQGNLLLLH